MKNELLDRYNNVNNGYISREEMVWLILPKVDRIISDKEELLRKLLSDWQVVKFGIDPTWKDIHLWHSISMNVLRYIQKMWHDIKFVIWDFTAKIGDPTWKKKERPPLNDEEIKNNYETYKEQASNFLDFSKIEVINNSNIIKKVEQDELVSIFTKIPVSEILQREDFKNRLEKWYGFNFAEMYYPILMAFDSLEIKPDIEVGWKDQLLNLVLCRRIMSRNGFPPETVLTTTLLPWIRDKDEKMSKSLNNYISLQDKPEDIYWKVMSIPDDLILTYYKSLTDLSFEELEKVENNIKKNPYGLKKSLAYFITYILSDKKSADEAEYVFNKKFSKKELSEDLFEKMNYNWENKDILWVLKDFGIISSLSEWRRLLKQWWLYIWEVLDNIKRIDGNEEIKANTIYVKKWKKKFYKIIVK